MVGEVGRYRMGRVDEIHNRLRPGLWGSAGFSLPLVSMMISAELGPVLEGSRTMPPDASEIQVPQK